MNYMVLFSQWSMGQRAKELYFDTLLDAQSFWYALSRAQGPASVVIYKFVNGMGYVDQVFSQVKED
jgi:hypothetical protein